MRLAVLALLVVASAGCAQKGPDPDALGEECRPTAAGAFAFGKVVDSGQDPLAGANVTAKGIGSHRHEVSSITPVSGCYSLELPPGQFHDLTAAKSGYATREEKTVALNVDEKRKINFELPSA